MLTIRRKQMAAFQDVMDDRFVEETIAYLREEHPETIRGIAPEIRRRRVKQGFARARAYGIESDVCLRLFVAMMFDLGPHFDRHPAVAKILSDETLAGDDRLDAITFTLSDRVWEELAILAGGDQWDDETQQPSGAA